MPESTDQIAELIRQGRKIEAIKLLREDAGIGLKEAKERVEKVTIPGSGCMSSVLLLIVMSLLVSRIAIGI